jgi:lipopolysaccharide heptosyltransferase II
VTTNIPMKRLQSADKILGLALCVLLQPFAWVRGLFVRPRDTRAVLMIKFWGIGSLQLLTPAIASLRRRHPGARLTLLTLSENAAFARGLGVFDEVLTLDVRCGRGFVGWIRTYGRIFSIARRLRAARYDRVYDFEFFTRFSALISLATGAPETAGFSAPSVWRGHFHTHTVPFNRYWHVARNFRALAGGEDGADVRHTDLAPYRFTAEDEAGAARALAERGLAIDRPFIVVNPNAGQLSLERRWPSSSFATLARTLAIDDGTPIVFVGAPGEREYVGEIVAQVGALPQNALCDLSGELSMGEFCALLARASTLVTNDSGPMHLGAALGTPTIGLFGPETPVMYGPIGARTTALWKPPVCSPCINVHENKVANCIHGRPECLVNIAVDDVLEETRSYLWDNVLTPAARLPRRAGLHVLRGGESVARGITTP